jgi:hypothetical protein
MGVVTNQPIQLSYFVQDITTALLTYNRLRWHRSRTGQYGIYEPATAALPTPAVLVGTAASPFQLNGKTLSFRVNGITQVDVVFTNPDPVTIAQVVTAVGLATPLVTAADDGSGKLKLTTVITGTGGSIEILESDAAPFLGFVTGDGAVGQDQDTILVAGTHEYFYTDQNSDREFWYRAEFRHSTTLKTTGLGVPFPANKVQQVSKSLTIVGYVRLSDMSGFPIGCRRITFSNPFLPNTVIDQTTRWGVFRHYAQIETDRNGYAEIRLLRGMTVDVSIDGTGFVRRIQIPTTGDVVDILDPVLVVRDEFGIQQPQIDFAIRTT